MKELGRIFGFSKSFPNDGAQTSPDSELALTDHRLQLQLRSTIWADMANALLALEQKSRDPNTAERKEAFRSIARHIDRLAECLVEIGIETQNHTNQPFDSGQSLEVLAFQPTKGISRETVVETIKPTVYLKGYRLQIGQVIVATPDQPEEKEKQCQG